MLLGAECVCTYINRRLGHPIQAIHTIIIRKGERLHLELELDIHMHARCYLRSGGTSEVAESFPHACLFLGLSYAFGSDLMPIQIVRDYRVQNRELIGASLQLTTVHSMQHDSVDHPEAVLAT